MTAFPDGGACAGQRVGFAHRFDDVAPDALAGSGQLAKEVAGVGGGQGLVNESHFEFLEFDIWLRRQRHCWRS